METHGVVAGSLDSITRGHEWLIREASRLVDVLDVVIGVNAAKRYYFTDDERLLMAQVSLADLDLGGTPVRLHFLKDDLLVNFAERAGATHLIRGLRNATDYAYETDMALVNHKLNPNIRTVFLNTPVEFAQVSSSTVKSLVGFANWEKNIEDYVHPFVIEMFRRKLAERAAG